MGTLDVTVAQIARAAGMSPALAHHYFGSKDQIFLAAMRHILTVYGRSVRAGLPGKGARGRLDAIISTSFAPPNFRREVVSAWLNFYALAQVNPQAARLLRLYRRRLHSNLVVALRGLTARPDAVAHSLGALIDGVYLREVMSLGPTDAGRAIGIVNIYLEEVLS